MTRSPIAARSRSARAPWLRIAALLAFALAGITTIPASATSEEPQESQDPQEIETLEGEEINDDVISSEEAEEDPDVEQFLLEQARRGRPLDVEDITVAHLDHVDATLIWEDAVAIDAVGITEDVTGSSESNGPESDQAAADDAGPIDAMGFTLHEVEGADSQAPMPPGMGSGAFSSVSGATRMGGTCTSVTTEGNRATSCYEKYKVTESNTTFDRWVYNRWGTGTPGSGHRTKEVTIRSRPWSGTSSRVAQLNDYYPRQGGNICPSGSAEIGISFYGLSAKMPIQSCSITAVDPNATEFSMMTRWKASDWSFGSKTAKAVDFSMNMSTWQGQTLTMADYIWTAHYNTYMEVCETCHVTSWKDSGW